MSLSPFSFSLVPASKTVLVNVQACDWSSSLQRTALLLALLLRHSTRLLFRLTERHLSLHVLYPWFDSFVQHSCPAQPFRLGLRE